MTEEDSTAVAMAELVAAFETGQGSKLERGARAYLRGQPDDVLALTLLAASLQMQQQPHEAAGIYRQLAFSQPNEATHWNNLGTALRECHRLVEAEEAYRHSLKLDPDDPMIHHNLGLLSMDTGDFAQAREHLLDAHARDRMSIPIRVYAAMACHECGDFQRVEILLAPWPHWDLSDDDIALDLAWLLSMIGQTQSAQTLLETCARRMPQPERALTRLVQLFERVNRLDEARQITASLPDPRDVDDVGMRKDIINVQALLAVRDGAWEQAYTLFSELLRISGDEGKLSNLYFGLARVCDRLGRPDEAMAICDKAHRAQVHAVAPLVPEMLASEVEPLKVALARWDAVQYADAIPVATPAENDSPVFVVGFPRSGTTLLEQMLDSHLDLCAMDERPYLQGLAERMESSGLAFPNDLGRLDNVACGELRDSYWRSVSKIVQVGPGQRLVDKNPLNLLRLPMICRLFPHARIILALRHPCDVLLSCYMQSFRSPAFAVLCSSLDRLARSYANVMEYWLYHTRLLGPQVLELRYEDLVDDVEVQALRLGAFLGLPDASALLDFRRHAEAKGFISTPSYAQVVEGINRKGLDRWHRYRGYFEPVLPVLRPFMERWNYLS
jgi:Flp pilus assembly protein TadD